MNKKNRLHVRTLFLSDTHLGSKGSRAHDLSRFLKRVRAEKIYLVGDIIDMWRLKSRWYWPREHNDVIRRLLKASKRGSEVIYLPGNHDDGARQFAGLNFGGVEVRLHDLHTTADGKKLFICHGDQYDLVVQHSRLLSMLGAAAYELLLKLNRIYNAARHRLGKPYMSLSQIIKAKVKRACTFISRFEDALTDEARRRGVDGVVCGHIHKAEVRTTDTGLLYLNCGDWVESCTALVEHFDGRIELLNGLSTLDSLKHLDQSDETDDPDDLDDIDAQEGIAAVEHLVREVQHA